MATKGRKSRLNKKYSKAVLAGNYKKSDRLDIRQGRIATREGNRAIGNTAIQKGLTNVNDVFRNVRGLPAGSLSANVNDALKTRTPEQLVGTISSPELLREQRRQAVITEANKNTGNSQNSSALVANVGPITPASTATTPSGSKGGSTVTPTVTTTPENVATVDNYVELPPSTMGSSARSASTPSASSTPSGSVFGGYSTPSTVGGIQLNPDGTTALGSDFSYALTPEQRAEEEARRREIEHYNQESKQSLSRKQTMEDAMRQFQGEIDAVNSVFADKINQARLEGADRLGSDRAANFNAGATNSTFGEASKQRVLDFNRGQEGTIYNEKLKLISEINSAARAVGDKYYEQKKAAKEAGLESYMSLLTGSKEAKMAIATDVASNIIKANLTPDNMTEKQLKEISKNAGVSVEAIKKAYDDETERLAKEEEDKLLAEQEAAVSGQYTLSKDQIRYDANGNIIAQGVNGEDTTETSGSASNYRERSAENVLNYIDTALEQILPGAAGLGSGALSIIRGSRQQDLENTLETIKGNIGFEALQAMREASKTGGALGQVAVQELTALQSTLGSLSTKQSRKQLETNLNNIKAHYQNAMDALNQSGGQSNTITTDDGLNWRVLPDGSYEQVSFNSVGSDTNNANAIASAIKQVESQGNYNARGGSGEIGAYQFMPSTWKQWASEYLGNPNAPMTPENQDYVANAKITDLLNQGYNAQEIALIWNGGTPKVKKGVNKYGVAYDSGAYAQKVLNALG